MGQRSTATPLPLMRHSGPWSSAWGSQGVCRNPRLAASRGRDRAAAATVAAQLSPPSPLLRHGGGVLPRVIPLAPPAAAFPLPSAGATRPRPLPPSPSLRWSAPSRRGGRRPCAGQEYLPHKQSHTSAAEEDRHHLADRGRHVDADALLGSTPSTSAQAPRQGLLPLLPPLPPPLP